ncbi:unnamed protein product [Scytosiphon promiscuus]
MQQQQRGGHPLGFRADTPSSSSSGTTDETPPRFDTAAAAVIAAGDLVYKFLYAYAVVACRFLHAHGAVAFDFLYAHALVVFEFLYAYGVVAVQEALAILEKVWSRARPMWRRWRERGPTPVKRVMKHRLFPVAVAVALSMLLVLPAYWAIPRSGGSSDGPGRLSSRQWQAKYDLLNSKYSADLLRQRLKYDNLAGRHLELQSEYESLLKDYKNQQRAARANRNAPKSPPETCDKAESVLGPVKEALKTAEQSAYDYFNQFSEGLRQDVHEIAERCLGKAGEEGSKVGDGRGSCVSGSERHSNRDRKNSPISDVRKDSPIDDDRKNSPIDDDRKDGSKGRGGGGGDTGAPAAAIEQAYVPIDAAEFVKHVDAKAEQVRAADEIQSQQQAPVEQQAEEVGEVEPERLRARVARRGMKGVKHVGWALKIEKPEATSTIDVPGTAKTTPNKKTESEAEEMDDSHRAERMSDDSIAALFRRMKDTLPAAQSTLDTTGERTEGDTTEVSGSAEMDEVGSKLFEEAGEGGTRKSGRGIGGKKISEDAEISDSVVVVFDEAVSGGVDPTRDVKIGSRSDVVDEVEVVDSKQVTDDKRSSRSFGTEGGETAWHAPKDMSRVTEVRALVRARQEIIDGRVNDVREAPEVKAVKPEEVKSEDDKDTDQQQPQTNKSFKVTLEEGELEGVRPHEDKEGGTVKFVKVEEAEPEGSAAGRKRKCSKQKDVNSLDGEKGEKGEKGGKAKEHRLKGEEDKPKRNKKKNKGGKSREKKKS